MRKILLATTALVGGAAIATSAVADAPALSISGNMRYVFEWEGVDATKDAATGATFFDKTKAEGWDIAAHGSNSELYFNASSTTDSGTTYGAKYDLRASGTVAADEAYLYFKNDAWGTIHFGQDDGAADWGGGADFTQAATGGIDGKNGIISPTVKAGVSIAGTSIAASNPLTADAFMGIVNSDDAAKIAYYTPSANGLSGGISIASTGASARTNSWTTDTVSYANIVEFGGAFTHSMNDVGFGLGVSVMKANPRTETRASVPVRFKKITAYEVGANVTFGAIIIGASVGDNGDAGVRQVVDKTSADTGQISDGGSWYALGLGYGFGDSNVSLGYFESERSAGRRNSQNVDSEAEMFNIGADTKLADGLDAFAEVTWSDVSTGQYVNKKGDLDSDATQLILGTKISF